MIADAPETPDADSPDYPTELLCAIYDCVPALRAAKRRVLAARREWMVADREYQRLEEQMTQMRASMAGAIAELCAPPVEEPLPQEQEEKE